MKKKYFSELYPDKCICFKWQLACLDLIEIMIVKTGIPGANQNICK